MFDLINRLIEEGLADNEVIEETEEMLRVLKHEYVSDEFSYILEQYEDGLVFKTLAEINADIADQFDLHVR